MGQHIQLTPSSSGAVRGGGWSMGPKNISYFLGRERLENV